VRDKGAKAPVASGFTQSIGTDLSAPIAADGGVALRNVSTPVGTQVTDDNQHC